MLLVFFFKQKTAYEMRISDWSSDVCSSDLRHRGYGLRFARAIRPVHGGRARLVAQGPGQSCFPAVIVEMRSRRRARAHPARGLRHAIVDGTVGAPRRDRNDSKDPSRTALA